MNTLTQTLTKPRLSAKAQTLAAILAVAGAVALPQIFHLLGAALGVANGLGETFLPMHLPIILAGLLAGPYVGLFAGAMGPLVSAALSGMPGPLMLPFMMIELGAYGFFAGVLSEAKLPTLGKVLAVQAAGRVLRALAMLIAVYALGNTALDLAVIGRSVVVGLPGLCLQWLLIPLVMLLLNKRQSNE